MPRRQGVALLAFLVLHLGRPLERESLTAALWPEEQPPAARSAFRALLSKLRSALGAKCLPGRERLQLLLPPGSWVDVEAAREAIHRAETAVASCAWAEAWGPARVALLIAERGFLVGHDAPWVDEEGGSSSEYSSVRSPASSRPDWHSADAS